MRHRMGPAQRLATGLRRPVYDDLYPALAMDRDSTGHPGGRGPSGSGLMEAVCSKRIRGVARVSGLEPRAPASHRPDAGTPTPASAKVGVLCVDFEWSGRLDACRAFWLDPQGWGGERMLAFEAASTSHWPGGSPATGAVAYVSKAGARWRFTVRCGGPCCPRDLRGLVLDLTRAAGRVASRTHLASSHGLVWLRSCRYAVSCSPPSSSLAPPRSRAGRTSSSTPTAAASPPRRTPAPKTTPASTRATTPESPRTPTTSPPWTPTGTAARSPKTATTATPTCSSARLRPATGATRTAMGRSTRTCRTCSSTSPTHARRSGASARTSGPTRTCG